MPFIECLLVAMSSTLFTKWSPSLECYLLVPIYRENKMIQIQNTYVQQMSQCFVPSTHTEMHAYYNIPDVTFHRKSCWQTYNYGFLVLHFCNYSYSWPYETLAISISLLLRGQIHTLLNFPVIRLLLKIIQKFVELMLESIFEVDWMLSSLPCCSFRPFCFHLSQLCLVSFHCDVFYSSFFFAQHVIIFKFGFHHDHFQSFN